MFGWRLDYILLRPHIVIQELYTLTKSFLQRGHRGYADQDVWSLDWYLSGWMPQALKQLQKNKMGYPADLTNKKWNKILQDMIKGFEADRRIGVMDFENLDEAKYLAEIRNKGLKLFAKYYSNLWD